MRTGETEPGLLLPEGAVTREILVMDDDKLTRWSLTKVFARAGDRVREAASTAEGIAAGFGSQGGHPLARPGSQVSSPSPRSAQRGSETKARRLGSHCGSNKDYNDTAQTLQSKKFIVLPRTFANVGLPDLTS